MATAEHVRVLRDLIVVSRVAGPKIHDARIAAICLAHGVSQLWTADRDFFFFPSLRTHNPLVARQRQAELRTLKEAIPDRPFPEVATVAFGSTCHACDAWRSVTASSRATST